MPGDKDLSMKTLPADFPFLPEMYADSYFPKALVDKVRDAIREVAVFIGEGTHTREEIQSELDRMTEAINDLQAEFDDQESEIETVARDSIGTTVEAILNFFEVDIDSEEAIRARDW